MTKVPLTDIPSAVFDDHGAVVPGPLECRRPTAKGTLCTIPRVEFSPACWHHTTDPERYGAEAARKVLAYDNLMQKVKSTGASMADPEVRLQVRKWVDRSRLQWDHMLNQGPGPEPLTEEQLRQEVVTAALEKDRIERAERGLEAYRQSLLRRRNPKA